LFQGADGHNSVPKGYGTPPARSKVARRGVLVQSSKSSLAALTLGAIGVVYGDIGTSVLYAIKEVFASGRVPFTTDNVYGILSIFFWTLTVIVSIKTDQHSLSWLERFHKAVADFPEVVEFYRMSGDVDYLLRVVVPDIEAYDAFYKRLIARIEIAKVSSAFAMEQIKYTTALPLQFARGNGSDAAGSDGEEKRRKR